VSAPTTALVFVGLLLTLVGLFAAGNLLLVAIGVVSLFGAGLLQTLAERAAR
jgi:hypothetical protein